MSKASTPWATARASEHCWARYTANSGIRTETVPGTAARGILYPMSAPNFGMIPQPLGRTPLSLRSGWNLRNLTRTCVTYSSAGTSLPGASCWRTSPSWAPTIFPQSGNSSARKMGKCGIPTIKSWQKT